jgi:catechol 2,3-dioxygenase-like lactoylglutathione lyase family enzyme
MICHVTITTDNIQDTVEFYQWLLDLPIDHRFPIGDGGEIVFFGKGSETKFEVIYHPDTKPKAADGITIGFAVTSLKEKMDLLDSRSIPHSPVIAPNPHASFCFFTDRNGVTIQLFEEH